MDKGFVIEKKLYNQQNSLLLSKIILQWPHGRTNLLKKDKLFIIKKKNFNYF